MPGLHTSRRFVSFPGSEEKRATTTLANIHSWLERTGTQSRWRWMCGQVPALLNSNFLTSVLSFSESAVTLSLMGYIGEQGGQPMSAH